MAKGTRQAKSLHELRQEIAHSRDRLARDLSGLRYEFDFPLKLRKSVQRNTGVWISAMAVAGVLLSFLPARRKIVKVKAGTADREGKGEKQKKGILEAGAFLAIARIAAAMLKPALTSYLTSKLSGKATRQRV